MREALAVLGTRRLLLALQDPCLPGLPSEDVGRGSPYGDGGAHFFDFAAGLGFTGIQLGPQGELPAGHHSPYDSTAFSRSTLSISLGALAGDPRWEGLLDPAALAALVRRHRPDPTRVLHESSREAQILALERVWTAFRDAPGPRHAGLRRRLGRFRRANAAWLERDGLFEVLATRHGTEDWREWGKDGIDSLDARLWDPRPGEEGAATARRAELARTHGADLERHALFQFVAHEQHAALRARLRTIGLELWGDLQIGYSHGDRWSLGRCFLRGWVLGAPPSRTNPEGQAWNYPVLDPGQYLSPPRSGEGGGGRDGRGTETGEPPARGPALELFRARLTKIFAEYDGVRIDHPHGLVCPWVYRADTADPDGEVARGRRLFSSPDDPALARFAIPRPDQIATDPTVPRHADGRVLDLDPEQVARYAVLIDEAVRAAGDAGRSASSLACEVLSTCPEPLRRVLARHGLGRFRVTQKVRLDDPDDVYRSENARPEDWVMVGTHDTPPIWRLLGDWRRSGDTAAQAAALARRLRSATDDRAAFARELETDPGALAHARFAELFASPAENVVVFFSDLFGFTEVFNRPGVSSGENWSLRIPPDYRDDYRGRVARGLALDLPRALSLAIEARGAAFATRHRDLTRRLAERSPASHRAR